MDETRIKQLESEITKLKEENQKLKDDIDKYLKDFESIQKVLPLAIHLYNLDKQQNVWASSSIEKVIGYTPEEFVSMSARELAESFHPEDMAKIAPFVKDMRELKDGESYEHESRMRVKNGEYRWFHSKTVPFSFDDQGNTTDIVGLSWDITKQKLYEEEILTQKHLIESILDNAPLIIFLFDIPKMKVVWVNKHINKDLGFTPDEWISFSPEEAIGNFHPEETNLIVPFLLRAGNLDSSNILEHEFRIKTKDGDWQWFFTRNIPFKRDENGNVIEIICVAQNINRYILAESELKKAKESAESANYSKSMFLANMSHEIRTPLNVIQGFTSLLSEKVIDNSQKKYLSYISNNASILLDLINDILDLSKVEAGKLQINKNIISLQQIFNIIKSMFNTKFSDKGVDFIWNIPKNLPENIIFDELRLKQILSNLISNALKFTDKGSVTINVSFKAVDSRLIDLRFDIKDTGVGIPETQKEKIFKVFEQKDGQDIKKYGGTGLGLSITKQLVSLLNGMISVSSIENQGTIFTVLFFNVEHTSENQNLLTNNTIFEFNSAKILVVEDSEINRVLVREFFNGTSIDVIEAENGEDAINKLKINKVDLVLMDLRMPIMDGYEATKLIKIDEGTKNIPIVALTASVIGKDFSKLKELGFDSFLLKPISKNLLFMELSKFLSHKKNSETSENISSFNSISKITCEKEFISRYFKENDSFHEDIKEELYPNLLEAMKNHFVEDIEKVATLLRKLGVDYKIQCLIDQGALLLSYCEEFDIEAMNSSLDEIYRFFNSIINQ
ncbi:PAS domain-containing protein [bacterium]|nr:PAS domain-containing protein [bacterium]